MLTLQDSQRLSVRNIKKKRTWQKWVLQITSLLSLNWLCLLHLSNCCLLFSYVKFDCLTVFICFFSTVSSLKEKSKPILINKKPYYVQGVDISSVRSDNTILLRDVKHEGYDLTTNTKCLRKPNMGENTLTDKRKVKASKHKKTLKKHAKKGTKSAELTNAKIKGTKKYSCMFCSKLFERKHGRNIHARFHRTCIGCKKVLDGVYSLGVHIESCAEYKKRMGQKAKKPPNICDRSSNTTVKPKVIIKKERLDVSISNSKIFSKYTASHK